MTSTPSDDPRLCVVGAGRHSTAHVYPNLARAGFDLVGVCDLDAEKAEHNARRFGGTPYSDLDAMLDAEEPAAVIVVVGPEAHADLAMRILERDLPVYTEKPPAADAASARAVAEAAAASDAFCMTAFKKRYSRAFERAREFVESFDPGERATLSVDYASASYGDRDFLLDFTVHHIDLVTYLFGPVERVSASARGLDSADQAYGYAVSLEFECGAVGTMTLTDGRVWDLPTETVELTMDGGNFITVENSSRWRIVEDGQPSEWHEPPTHLSSGEGDAGTGHVAELEAFRDALYGEHEPRSGSIESYRSMVLFEAIRDAARTDGPVEVQYEL